MITVDAPDLLRDSPRVKHTRVKGAAKAPKRHRKIKKTAFVVNFMLRFTSMIFINVKKSIQELPKIKLSAPHNVTHKFL